MLLCLPVVWSSAPPMSSYSSFETVKLHLIYTAHNKIPQPVPHRIRMNNLTTNVKIIGREEGPRINRPDETFFSLWPKHIFPQKELPSLVLSPQATLKFLWSFACLHLSLPHFPSYSLSQIYPSHLGFLPILLLSG